MFLFMLSVVINYDRRRFDLFLDIKSGSRFYGASMRWLIYRAEIFMRNPRKAGSVWQARNLFIHVEVSLNDLQKFHNAERKNWKGNPG